MGGSLRLIGQLVWPNWQVPGLSASMYQKTKQTVPEETSLRSISALYTHLPTHHILTCAHIHTPTDTHTYYYTHFYTHTYVHTLTTTPLHAHKYSHTDTKTVISTYFCTHTHVHTLTHTHIYIYMYILMHIPTQSYTQRHLYTLKL